MTAATGRAHVRALDGVRGLAIGLVLLYHGWTFDSHGDGVGQVINTIRQVGWAGVDVFFVMSGFLITGILLESKGQPRYWQNFLVRRGLRIFPVYYVVLVVILIGCFVFPDLGRGTVGSIWVNFAYLTNFWIAIYGENHVPLDSAWSLAIEEQFYLAYPLLVRSYSRETLAKILVGVVIAAPTLRWLTHVYGAQPTLGPYVLPYCRMDALAIGALVRLAFDRTSRTWVANLGKTAPIACGLALVALMILQRKDPVFIVFGYTLSSVAGATLLAAILTAPPSSLLRRAFEWSPLVYLGKISYCVYLIHLIARVVVDKALAHVFDAQDRGLAFCVAQLGGMLVLSVAGATVSYHYLERPILRLKDRWAPVTPGSAVEAR